jgi:general secretion pathway protein G
VKTARTQIEMLGAALDTFRLDVGRYPTSQEGLEALRERPSSGDRWDGPYLKKDVPKDPWGNLYIYRSPETESPMSDVIRRDGVAGGTGDSADIKSWEG